MTMKKLTFGEHEIFIGVHPTLGLVIYDKEAQGKVDSGLGADWVRLFKLNEFKTGKFIGPEVRGLLTVPAQEQIDEARKPIRQYLSILSRTTGCYRCGNEINTVDFSICTKCWWIKCACGACGCGYKEHKIRKANAEAARRKREDEEISEWYSQEGDDFFHRVHERRE